MERYRKNTILRAIENIPNWYPGKHKKGDKAVVILNMRSPYYVRVRWLMTGEEAKYPIDYFESLGQTWNEKFNKRGGGK